MDPNLTQNPTSKHSELVVGWYQQQLADSHLMIANLSAQNAILTARVTELTTHKDPNDLSKSSDA